MVTCGVRKRGDVLKVAVYSATISELAEHGMRRLTMEGIASRAGTGKAALYRRWPNVRALVLDTLAHQIEEVELKAEASSGDLRTDLVRIFGKLAVAASSPSGKVLLELIGEASRDREMMSELEARYGRDRQKDVIAAVELAILRGEIERQDLDAYVLDVAPALIFNDLFFSGTATSPDQIEHIVDRIVMPLLTHPHQSQFGA